MLRSLRAPLSFTKQTESLFKKVFVLSRKVKLPFFRSVNELTTVLGSGMRRKLEYFGIK